MTKSELLIELQGYVEDLERNKYFIERAEFPERKSGVIWACGAIYALKHCILLVRTLD